MAGTVYGEKGSAPEWVRRLGGVVSECYEASGFVSMAAAPHGEVAGGWVVTTYPAPCALNGVTVAPLNPGVDVGKVLELFEDSPAVRYMVGGVAVEGRVSGGWVVLLLQLEPPEGVPAIPEEAVRAACGTALSGEGGGSLN